MNKRILIIGTDIHPPCTTMESHLSHYLKEKCDQHGFSIKLLSISLSNKPYKHPDYTYVNSSTLPTTILKKISYGLRLIYFLEKSISSKPDIIHFMWVGFPFLSQYLYFRLKFLSKIKIVTTILNQHAPPNRYKHSEHIIFHSKQTYERYIHKGFSSEKCTLIPPPANPHLYSPIKRGPEIYFVFASGPRTKDQITPRGIHLLFKTFASLNKSNSNVSLKFFNRWPDGAQILESLKSKYCAENVTIRNDFAQDLPEIIKMSSGVIIPYTTPTIGDIPLSAIESFTCGRPVIATRYVSLNNILTAHKAGISIEPTAESLANAISNILTEFNAYSHGALEAAKYFNFKSYISKTFSIYNNIKKP